MTVVLPSQCCPLSLLPIAHCPLPVDCLSGAVRLSPSVQPLMSLTRLSLIHNPLAGTGCELVHNPLKDATHRLMHNPPREMMHNPLKYRLRVLAWLPQLRQLDFMAVSAKERLKAKVRPNHDHGPHVHVHVHPHPQPHPAFHPHPVLTFTLTLTFTPTLTRTLIRSSLQQGASQGQDAPRSRGHPPESLHPPSSTLALTLRGHITLLSPKVVREEYLRIKAMRDGATDRVLSARRHPRDVTAVSAFHGSAS